MDYLPKLVTSFYKSLDTGYSQLFSIFRPGGRFGERGHPFVKVLRASRGSIQNGSLRDLWIDIERLAWGRVLLLRL
jgi:hypothetical protein